MAEITMYAATAHQICSFTALLVVRAEELHNAQTGLSHPEFKSWTPPESPEAEVNAGFTVRRQGNRPDTSVLRYTETPFTTTLRT